MRMPWMSPPAWAISPGGVDRFRSVSARCFGCIIVVCLPCSDVRPNRRAVAGALRRIVSSAARSIFTGVLIVSLIIILIRVQIQDLILVLVLTMILARALILAMALIPAMILVLTLILTLAFILILTVGLTRILCFDPVLFLIFMQALILIPQRRRPGFRASRE